MSLDAAILNLVAKAAALPGMKSAPNAPIESAGGVFPFAVVYEFGGTLDMKSSGFANDNATIYVEMHVERTMLPQAIASAMTFRDPFLLALMADPTLGGTVSTVNQVRRTFGAMKWANTETIGYRFEVDVKVKLEA